MVEEHRICELESWKDVRTWVMPERRRVEFWVRKEADGVWKYKVEIMFEDILESIAYCLGGEKLNALLLKVCYLVTTAESSFLVTSLYQFISPYGYDLSTSRLSYDKI